MIEIGLTGVEKRAMEPDLKRMGEILAEIRDDKMGGWLELPVNYDKNELSRIKAMARKIQSESDVLVCIGIGGSYLGHRAAIEALELGDGGGSADGDKARCGADDRERAGGSGAMGGADIVESKHGGVEIIYAGNSLSQHELEKALKRVKGRDFSVNVISKSGTTIEPKVAFDEFKKLLIEKYGIEAAAERIYATTDAEQGALHDEAVAQGYTRLVVPDNIGGRYSVLSAVGLLPMCAAGVDVDAMLDGAREMMVGGDVDAGGNDDAASGNGARVDADAGVAGDIDENVADGYNLESHPAVRYAWLRYVLGEQGYDTEVFASFEPRMAYFNEWLKQLFGESEGKDQQGVWPASVIYSTDLHSLGQFMQEGRRNLWETIIDIPTDTLNYQVERAVKKAHTDGGIPVVTVKVNAGAESNARTGAELDEKSLGQLIYFFELACAMSAKLFQVNPFDQPGVEAYKNELKKIMNDEDMSNV